MVLFFTKDHSLESHFTSLMKLPISLHLERFLQIDSPLLQLIKTKKKPINKVKYKKFHRSCTYLTYLIFCPKRDDLKIMISPSKI